MEISVLFPADPDLISEKDMSQTRPFSVFNSSTSRTRPVIAIVAMASDRAIGKDGGIPWRLPEDMAHFKSTTMGHPVVMGRKTWESLPQKPLPGRRNIVITHSADYQADGAEVAASLEEAIALCDIMEIPMITGGASIYAASLSLCSEVIVTEVECTVPDADTYFPELPENEWQIADKSEKMCSRTGLGYRFITFRRK